MKTIVSDVVSLLASQAKLHHVSLHFQVMDDDDDIECEPNQLKQLFINLIKNAIEACSENGQVLIELSKPQLDVVNITVVDNGHGMDEEKLIKVGEPFYSTKDKGTGLGLTVSSKIVNAHNGSMEFESERGVGTKVIVSFPTKQLKKTSAQKKKAFEDAG